MKREPVFWKAGKVQKCEYCKSEFEPTYKNRPQRFCHKNCQEEDWNIRYVLAKRRAKIKKTPANIDVLDIIGAPKDPYIRAFLKGKQ